jgi:hypothetical protein
MNVIQSLMKASATGAPAASASATGGAGNQGNGLLAASPALLGAEMLRTISFQIGRRNVGADQDQFTLITQPGANGGNGNANAPNGGNQLSINAGRLAFNGIQQLDGEYLILVPMDSNGAVKVGPAQAQQKGTNAGTSATVGNGHMLALLGVLLGVILL